MAALTLTAGFRQLGDAIAPDDRQAVVALSNHFRANGLSNREAALQAIHTQLARIDAALEEMGAGAEPVSQPEAAMPPQSHEIPPQPLEQGIPQQ
jgi:hypothetical protein